jgi:peptidoglycan/LPS O-acetylase OafA/YrhL
MAFIINPFEIENVLFKQVLIYITVVPVVILIAYLSFNYFEQLFLKLKYNYTIINSTSSKSEFEKLV